MTKTFRDLRAFQAAVDLAVEIYAATESFPRTEMYGLISQMRRASCGTASDIAEGQGRLTFGEWRRLLSDARGSLYELQAQMIISQRLGFLAAPEAARLQKLADNAGRELAGLITWVKRRDAESKRRLRVRPQTTNN